VRAFCGTNTVIAEYDRVETGHQYATVFIRNGSSCLNEELLRTGLGGVDIRTMFRYWAAFGKAQEEARRAKRGVWAEPKAADAPAK
jgi:endonuclease YncB( thermonuclease family)